MSESRYFNPVFIQQMMNEYFTGQEITVSAVKSVEVDNSASILAVLASASSEHLIGHFGLEVEYVRNGWPETKRMVMKIKPHGDEIVEMLNMLANACGPVLAPVYQQYKKETGFQFTHLREQEIYSKLHPDFTPQIYGLCTDEEAHVYIILMEYLEDVSLLNSVMEAEKWTDAHIKTTLSQMAEWHSEMLNYKTAPIHLKIWEADEPDLAYMSRLTPLWTGLLNNAKEKFPELYTQQRSKKLQKVIEEIPIWGAKLEGSPKTLAHNDLNPRNTCFKSINGKLQLCAYDWELATFQIPQYDIVELLCFVLDKDRYHLRYDYLEFYRNKLHHLTGSYGDAASFKEEFKLAALNFGIHRLGMYMMAHSVSPYPFLPRVVNSFFDTIEGG